MPTTSLSGSAVRTADPIGRFLAIAAEKPDHPALDFDDDIVTYSELAGLARCFAARFAVVRVPRVLILLPQGPDAYAAIFGAVLSGGTYIPVNVDAPPNKLARLLQFIEPNVIVADRLTLHQLQEICPSALLVDPKQVAGGEKMHGEGQRNTVAYTILTSGSTGVPKGVVIPMAGLAHYVDWMVGTNVIGPHDRVSQFPSISFDLSVLDIYGALNAGATLVPAIGQADRLFPGDFARRSRLSVWVSVPSVMSLAMKGRQANSAMLGSVRRFIFCGEVLRKAHLSAIFDACPGAEVMNLYGPTEATVSVTSITLRKDDLPQVSADSVALGDPIPDMDINLIGGEHADEGEIVITGPQLANGYWRDQERTDSAFKWLDIRGKRMRGYFTGDWAERRGRHIYFKGRIDNQIKINGYRIETGEIVARIADCGWPVACVVKHRDQLSAVVEDADGKPSDPAALHAMLYSLLDSYAVPARIHFVQRMPRSVNDKLDEITVRNWLEEL